MSMGDKRGSMSVQQRVRTVERIARRDGKASTLACAAEWFVSDRTARRWLTELERAALVARVGVKGGWLPLSA